MERHQPHRPAHGGSGTAAGEYNEVELREEQSCAEQWRSMRCCKVTL